MGTRYKWGTRYNSLKSDYFRIEITVCYCKVVKYIQLKSDYFRIEMETWRGGFKEKE